MYFYTGLVVLNIIISSQFNMFKCQSTKSKRFYYFFLIGNTHVHIYILNFSFAIKGNGVVTKSIQMLLLLLNKIAALKVNKWDLLLCERLMECMTDEITE